MHRHLGLLVFASQPTVMVSLGLASKPASAMDGARGAITQFVSQLSEVINVWMDSRPAQDEQDISTPRC